MPTDSYLGLPREQKTEAVTSKAVTEQMHDMLHTDQSGLVAGLEEVLNAVKGWRSVTVGRGSYEWDDDRYRDEFGNFLRAVDKAATDAIVRWKLWKRPCCKLLQSTTETTENQAGLARDTASRDSAEDGQRAAEYSRPIPTKDKP